MKPWLSWAVTGWAPVLTAMTSDAWTTRARKLLSPTRFMRLLIAKAGKRFALLTLFTVRVSPRGLLPLNSTAASASSLYLAGGRIVDDDHIEGFTLTIDPADGEQGIDVPSRELDAGDFQRGHIAR